MTVTAAEAAAPLAAYARRFHALTGGSTHHVASPLGAWLLLALVGPASSGEERAALEEALGCDPAGAAGLWAGSLSGDLERWRSRLPAGVATGSIPSQDELDEWARRYTFGLIDRFPLDTSTATVLLATALATKVSWQQPFELAPAGALGPSSTWRERVRSVLRTPRGPGHQQFIAPTAGAGEVAVQAARAAGGLLVVSVAAAPEVPAGAVLAAAYEIAPRLALGERVPSRSLFDLAVGETPLWAITEQAAEVTGPDGREERCVAVLPAWSARSQLDLSDPSLGLAAASGVFDPVDPWAARQAAMARFTREGFEAAAVTAVVRSASMIRGVPGLVRAAELRFGHPYAVVAVAIDGARDLAGAAGSGSAVASPWNGVPVFSAWVAEPEDAADG